MTGLERALRETHQPPFQNMMGIASLHPTGSGQWRREDEGSGEQNMTDCRCLSMDRKGLIARTLAKAEKYYGFSRWVDRETARRILELTAKLKRRARAIAKPTENRIRRRARQLWEESGRPSGRDLEFWLQAEREFREAEDLARQYPEDVE
jgi:Protein of unknown function (DUF2934)